MSHLHSTSQSLPHDYAIRTHFNDNAHYCQDHLHSIPDDDNEAFYPRNIRRVSSTADISERTPLITHGPPESTDGSVFSDQSSELVPSPQMFREELSTLTRYSLPVFAYAQMSS